MFQTLSYLNSKSGQLKKFGFLLPLSIKPRFLVSSSSTDPSVTTPSSCRQTGHNPLKLSSLDFIGVAESVLSRCHFATEESKRKRENFYNGATLKALLLDLSHTIPDVTRRFMRVSRLKPEDVLELLLGFQLECERVRVRDEKVESLWLIFEWANDSNYGFRHLPKSCEVMATILIRHGMFREVQLLLLATEKKGIDFDECAISSQLIEGYVGVYDGERALLVYDIMRQQCLEPSLLSCRVLLKLLVRTKKTKLAFRVCLDMLEMGMGFNNEDMTSFQVVVRLLCRDGMIQEARNLVKKLMALGLQPSSIVVNEIAFGYCEKKDFEDSLSIFVDMNCSPNVFTGNKIVNLLCSNYGVERANLFRLEMEHLGFKPDEVTFGILICWCCYERNLRGAFIYLSEMLSKSLKPDVWSYNALIAAVFKGGLWKHAGDILEEMLDGGATPNLSTFEILLAGYCKARQFDRAKKTVLQMVDLSLIESCSVEDPLSKSFTILGLNPFSVRLKRDNDIKFVKTEFFDHLGNGLYLDTDVDEYDKRLMGILDQSLVPDFNSLIKKEYDNGNFKAAILLVDEMARWGQELSLAVFSRLVKQLCASRSHFKMFRNILQKLPKLANQLDQEVQNLLIQAYCKNGLTLKGKKIFNEMLCRNLTITNMTYTAVLKGLNKKGSLRDLYEFWDVLQGCKWLPELEDCNCVIECMCRHGMLMEALELLKRMMVLYPHSRSEICQMFLQKLCSAGFSGTTKMLVEELLRQGFVLDELAYSHLMKGLCQGKFSSVAFTILDKMLASKFVPPLDIVLFMIPPLCRENRLAEAFTMREIVSRQNPSFSNSVDSSLIKGLCMVGKVDEAAALNIDILAKGALPDAEVHNMLFQGYCQAKNLRKVKELLAILIRKFASLSFSSYQRFVKFMCAEGKFICALNLTELMLREGKSDELAIYNILIFYLFSVGNSLLVNKVLNQLQKKGLNFDEVTYNFLVYGFAKCKDVPNCLQYLSTMISIGLRLNYRSLRSAMTLLSEIGELDKMLELSQEIGLRGSVHGSVVQNLIVKGLLSSSKYQEAEYFLDQMADKDLIPDTINYDNLIKCFCVYGRPQRAVDLLNIMLKKANLPCYTSYESIIHCLCTCNHLNQALDFHAEMLDRDLKPSFKTWDLLVRKLCENGETTEAEKLLNLMVWTGEAPTRLMYSTVIEKYRAENNLLKASELVRMMQQSGYEPDFDTHWSLISKLSDINGYKSSSEGFLSKLLSGSGFSQNKDLKAKKG
ncbi:hypothetical protein K2173_020355 [Erythroxylum novogranatense]|uniref:Pentatricopeptide repeat-containing protein-mitochondrial domain-containing protein n=1 Tax=Erythroxylum novogranatense TaxID=1862640 RepID=A0AAV8U8Y2_9ROSI|nr:hypothetical protein K2173_020355 [Erythroxylum novogranatense]